MARISARQKVVFLLASGHSMVRAAQLAGVGLRTVVRWKSEPGFQAEVKKEQAALIAQAAARLGGLMTRAAWRLGRLLRCKDNKIALAACRAVLELGTKLRESEELEERIAALERRNGGKRR